MLYIVMDGLLQFAHVVEAAPADAAPSDLGEEPLHLIQPTGAGGCEVQVVPRMSREPASHRGRFMSSIVIHHDVNLWAGWQLPLHRLQELAELPRTVAALTF